VFAPSMLCSGVCVLPVPLWPISFADFCLVLFVSLGLGVFIAVTSGG